jgi:hypothetical protein
MESSRSEGQLKGLCASFAESHTQTDKMCKSDARREDTADFGVVNAFFQLSLSAGLRRSNFARLPGCRVRRGQ